MTDRRAVYGERDHDDEMMGVGEKAPSLKRKGGGNFVKVTLER